MGFRNGLIAAGLVLLTLVAAFMLYARVLREDKGSEFQRGMILSLFHGEGFSAGMYHQDRWVVYDPDGKLTAYAFFGTGEGYEGPVRVLTLTDPGGIITKVYPYEHQETPSYFAKLFEENFLESFEGMSVSGFDGKTAPIDVVTGATISSGAIIRAVSRSVR